MKRESRAGDAEAEEEDGVRTDGDLLKDGELRGVNLPERVD